jgi:ribosomal protein S8
MKLKKNSYNLVKIFYELNIIRRFYKLNNNVYKIFPTYTKYGQAAKTFKSYYRLKNPIILKKSSLVIINYSMGNSNILLDTNKGLLTHNEALKKDVGGILVCVVL